jgi:heme exporter protein C
MRRAERTVGRVASRRGERVLAVAASVALAATLVMALFVTPPDAEQGQVFRLIYVHVPSAWLAYLSFAVVLVASIAYLVTRRIRWDRLAAASAEVGVVFTSLTLILGSIWAKPVWGTWWTWDPRLTTTAVLLLIYVGYLAVRRLTDDPRRRATWAAVVGIVGFIDVPIVHLSVVWWRSLHQAPAVARIAPRMAPIMGWTLVLSVAAFTLLYAYLVVLRLRVGRLEERAVAEALSPRIGRPAAVAAASGEPSDDDAAADPTLGATGTTPSGAVTGG